MVNGITVFCFLFCCVFLFVSCLVWFRVLSGLGVILVFICVVSRTESGNNTGGRSTLVALALFGTSWLDERAARTDEQLGRTRPRTDGGTGDGAPRTSARTGEVLFPLSVRRGQRHQ